MMNTITALASRGLLRPIDAHFARALHQIDPAADERALLLAAMVNRSAASGHVCLDLRRPNELLRAALEDLRTLDAALLAPQELAAVARSSALFGGADRKAPLVIDDCDRLYLRRYFDCQQRLAAALCARWAAEPLSIDAEYLERRLLEVFPRPADTGQDRLDGQRRAARAALVNRFTVILGGPGTGKTSTVAKIMALLAEDAERASRKVPRFVLAAPTGKAAARLEEAIRQTLRSGGVAKVDGSASWTSQIEAKTLHRALGWSFGLLREPRFGRANQLPADVVIVDEASMVDLPLMTRLVEATPLGARLLLIGDPDQLASVEAGAVLADLSAAGRGNAVLLTHNFRFEAAEGISRLAQAIRTGNQDEACSLLGPGGSAEVRHLEIRDFGALAAALEPLVLLHYGEMVRAALPAERLSLQSRFGILSAHRQGPFGAQALSPLVERILADKKILSPRQSHYDGQPLIFTANDYETGLFNGDRAVIARSSAAKESPLVAFTQGKNEALRSFSPLRLPAHETAFAITVHRAQGTELDHVAVILPDKRSEVTTRELLYTAVTRAKKSVLILGPLDVVREAIAAPAERSSGLASLLARQA